MQVLKRSRLDRCSKAESYRKQRRGGGMSHQAQKIEEEVGVLADQVVGLAAEINKVMETAGRLVPTIDDVCHI